MHKILPRPFTLLRPLLSVMGAPKVRTRIAPSPTGLFHVGTARTALFNYLFAKGHGGEFILRIEDTDRTRSQKSFEADILNNLDWLGLRHDAFFRQSDRLAHYRMHVERLLESNTAYRSAEAGEGEKRDEVIRLRNPGKSISFADLIRGDISFDTSELGDFVIAKSLEEPLYHLAAVVDDYEMGITHVIRGEDHISNTPRQILIQEALGFPRPRYAHIPLILAPDRSKLSKRHGATSISEFRERGYLPEALINYLALLGWNPGDDRELFSLEELVKQFDLSRIQKGGAVFDIQKLNWFNTEYLKRLSVEEFARRLMTFLPPPVTLLPQFSVERFGKVAAILQERLSTLFEITILEKDGDLAYYFSSPSYERALLSWKEKQSDADTNIHLQTARTLISGIPEHSFSSATVRETVFPYAELKGRGEVLWPLRVSLSGRGKSPDPFTLAGILGKDETLSRLDAALKLLRENK